MAYRELGLESSVYGILFGLFGLDAIVGGPIIMSRIIWKVSADWMAVLATISFLVSLVMLATVQNIDLLASAMVLAGVAQIMSLCYFGSCFVWISVKLGIARAASFYQLVLQAALVTGRVALGMIADQFVIRTALLSASTTKAVGLLVKLRYPLKADKDIEFTMAMQDLSTVRKRDGAFYWGLFRHDKKENVYIESFLEESWVEHLRQHERMTVADRSIQEHALAFHTDERPLKVSHFIASPFKGDSQRTDDDDNI